MTVLYIQLFFILFSSIIIFPSASPMKPKNNFAFSHPLLLLLLLLLLLSFTCFSPTFCVANDTITSEIFIKDPASLISSSSSFQLGFFAPPNSTSRYVGIWYNNIPSQTIVWVANRENPLKDASGIFTISKDGNLVVLDGDDTVLWSSNVSSSSKTNTSARILDSGNLVLEDNASGKILWESFKHPSDKFLPSMKFMTNTRTKEMIKLTSWNTPSNPSTGNFSVALEVVSLPEAVIWNNDDNVYWRSGPWNGQSFIGIPEMDCVYLSGFNLVIQNQEYTFSVPQNYSVEEFGSLFLTSQGNFVQSYWNPQERNWNFNWIAIQTVCLKGFQPKNEVEWNQGNWSDGCVRRTPLKCINSSAEGDGFLTVERVKLPYFVQWSDLGLTEDDCKQECLNNCSCNAYAYENGIRCMLWSKSDLIDIQKFESGGAALYIRLSYAELDDTSMWKYTTRTSDDERKGILELLKEDDMNHTIKDDIKHEDLPSYDYEELAIATNNFDTNNKLGKGGFGSVYKGKLLNGQEIAVKKLARTSLQGYEEFKNEVRLISKLQHRNLVRLFGYCMEREQQMLIYEYMPNLSLDNLIFGSSKHELLNWRQRFNIIDGIARGLLYLHRDSRVKIIHRDLKASNILLDQDLDPKISDFGMARILFGNEIQATQRAAGTYGYMSPEYAMEGLFSENGRKNTGFYRHEQALSLLEFAWKLWMEDNLIPLIEEAIYELCYQQEILRCIQVGLLCVQRFVNDRPNISTIISMLNSEILDLPSPKEPGFIGNGRPCESNSTESSQQNLNKDSVNNVTLTTIVGR
ncbi:hypothetical protein IC582_029432 [Cucumis melo]